ncbi:MAG: prolipoprotein diacylglyceryl transferase [Ancrocorticia sp.]|uniref:prolipoprotein diacylglyceryl transferase n=1 Tax=Ancrocorticia sp. TaxID=2593684 RepID=UPI003F8F24FB
MVLASIPSPSQAEWYIGPFPLRAYAIAIILGIIVAWWWMDRRYTRKGGPEDVSIDIAVWAVIFGILGGRIYHVITDYQLYFGPGKDPWRALYIWEGGLGIWGAIALGGVGVFIAMRRRGLRMLPMADALAPALLVAQALGRWGNYFNQELYGKPTDVPWALEIDPAHMVGGYPTGTTFHPTFLYESLWCIAGAVLLVSVEKRLRLVGGQLFAAYGMFYTAGRVWIEMMRIDDAHHILGLRLNVWTSIILFCVALVALIVLRKRYEAHPERNDIWLSDEAREAYENSRDSTPAEASEESDTPAET